MSDDVLDPNIQSGMTKIAIGIRESDSKILLQFPQPMHSITFDPENAVMVGKQLIDLATRLGVQVTIQAPKRSLTREKYNMLAGRVEFLLMKKRGENETNRVLAERITDLLCGELL